MCCSRRLLHGESSARCFKRPAVFYWVQPGLVSNSHKRAVCATWCSIIPVVPPRPLFSGFVCFLSVWENQSPHKKAQLNNISTGKKRYRLLYIFFLSSFFLFSFSFLTLPSGKRLTGFKSRWSLNKSFISTHTFLHGDSLFIQNNSGCIWPP